ncbi:MAG: hypothetical protein K2Y56_01325 [Methylobacterium sp.]|uniref:hypothetical protein n=1 Tax=Methylobacterium sp. TaxID=409 RepID=UPI0025F4BD3A|nr:hypothetical protein [Methylobacterium sp.]MBX9930174.1 hypothetical protein [Methylobacterium sp.]
MGKADPGMLDVIPVAALTGARLDAVIDLRVGECADGWFTFKPQKKEKAGNLSSADHKKVDAAADKVLKSK